MRGRAKAGGREEKALSRGNGGRGVVRMINPPFPKKRREPAYKGQAPLCQKNKNMTS